MADREATRRDKMKLDLVSATRERISDIFWQKRHSFHQLSKVLTFLVSATSSTDSLDQQVEELACANCNWSSVAVVHVAILRNQGYAPQVTCRALGVEQAKLKLSELTEKRISLLREREY